MQLGATTSKLRRPQRRAVVIAEVALLYRRLNYLLMLFLRVLGGLGFIQGLGGFYIAACNSSRAMLYYSLGPDSDKPVLVMIRPRSRDQVRSAFNGVALQLGHL